MKTKFKNVQLQYFSSLLVIIALPILYISLWGASMIWRWLGFILFGLSMLLPIMEVFICAEEKKIDDGVMK